MGKIISPAGEVTFSMKSLKRKGDDLVIIGTMGVWESEIYLSHKEVLRFFLSRSVVLTAVMLPIVLFRCWFKRRKEY
jgi:hypothetical protein